MAFHGVIKTYISHVLKYNSTVSAATDSLHAVSNDGKTRWCRSKLIIDSKADESPVTKADREAEGAMRQLLAERVPDHAVFGESLAVNLPFAEPVYLPPFLQTTLPAASTTRWLD